MVRRIALLFLLAIPVLSGVAQSISPLQEEAPESLFDFQIGDSEVDLILEGQWETGAAATLGFGTYRADGGDRVWMFPSTVPGLEPVPFFNRVDLTISLWLLDRFFFESGISDEFEISSLLFGYNGRPGEILESFLVGNTAIDMTAYPYLGFGDGSGVIGRDAPGLAATFATRSSRHELMIRLEPSAETEVLYQNGFTVSERVVDSADYVRSRFFVLPDNGLDSLSVYKQDQNGNFEGSDGHLYRLLAPSELFSFSLADGLVAFTEPPAGRIVVSYAVDGLSVGSSSLGQNSFFLLADGSPDPDQPADLSFDDPTSLLSVFGIDWSVVPAGDQDAVLNEYLRVTVDGEDALLLFQPGRYSPFERASFYEGSTAAAGGPQAVVRSSASGAIDSTLQPVTVDAGLLGLRVNEPRTFAGRYPFADPNRNQPIPALYGSAPERSASRHEIVTTIRVPADSIVVDPDYVPGSLTVLRNNAPTRGFSVSDTGEITFADPLDDLETVRVRYRTASGDGNGDLLIGLGNSISILPTLSAELAFGMRWKPVTARYSSFPGEYPGYLTISAAGTFQPNDNASVTAAAGLAYTVPDTTGVLRVNGMNGAPATIGISPSRILPSAVPAVDPDPADGIGLGTLNRGRLIKRDQSASGFGGGRELQLYDWDTPASQIFPYTDGGRTGPYAAVSADTGPSDFSGTVMVMEYELDDAHDWVAAESRLGAGRDFTGMHRISGQILVQAGGEGVRLFLQIGATDEDVDGDGRVDAGSAVVPAFEFDDGASGFQLLAGPVFSEQIGTEDTDGDGLLDHELPDLVLSREIALDPLETSWQRFDLDLTPAERRLLSSTRAARFIVQRDTSGPLTGAFVLSELSLTGSSFVVSSPPGAEVYVRERLESLVSVDSLESVFPAVSAQLEDVGALPQVLEVDWTGLAGGAVELRSDITPVSARIYDEFRVYLHGDGSPTTVLVELQDATGATVVSDSAAVSDTWEELALELPDSDAGITSLLISIEGPASGELLVDEISFWGPAPTPGAVGELSTRWSAGPLRIGDTTVVENLQITQELFARSDGYPDGLSSAPNGLSGGLGLAAEVFGFPVTVDAEAAWSPEAAGVQLGHSVGFPFSAVALSVTEQFRQSYADLGSESLHSLSLTAGPYGPVSVAAGWNRRSDPDSARMSWNVGLSAQTKEGATSGSATVGLDQNTAGSAATPAYPVAWVSSFGSTAPVPLPDSQTADLDLSFRSGGDLIGIELGATAVSDTNRTAETAGSHAEIESRLPVSFGDRYHVEGTITRRLDLTGEYSDAPIAQTLSDLWSQRYFYGSIPVWELLDPQLVSHVTSLTAGFRTAVYEPGLRIAVVRPIRSNRLALVIPTSAQLSADRRIERRDDVLSDTQRVSAELVFAAPNVLGRLGTAPLFDFYDSDEQTMSIAGGYEQNDRGESSTELDLDHELKLFWLSGRQVGVRSTGSATYSRDSSGDSLDVSTLLELRYEWKRPAPLLARAEILQPFAETPLVHTETLTVDSGWTRQSHVVLLRHASSLRLGERGSVELSGGAGVSASGTETRVWQAAFQAGIEGSLAF